MVYNSVKWSQFKRKEGKMPDVKIPNPHTETAEWVKFKRRKIGGHAAATIAGVNPYQNLEQLFDLIVHGIRDPFTEEKEAFLSWRLSLEPNIADRYAAETGRKIRRCGSCLHPDDDRIVCSPDREILKDLKGVGLLEIKSRDPIVWNQIKLTGAPGADWVQTQHYLMTRHLNWGAICEANVSTGKQIRFDIEADLEFHRTLFQKIQDFLADCEAGERPPHPVADPVRLPKVGGELVTVEQMDEKLCREFRGVVDGVIQARDILTRAKEFHEGVKTAAQDWMTGNGFDVVEGFGARIYYKEQNGRLTLDKKALARDNPDLDLTEYETRGNPFRTFRVFDRPVAITGQRNGE